MPIHTGQDKNGNFYQWGKTGKKYYFKPGDEASRKRARGKAEAQQTAIYSSGWKGDKQTMKLIKVKKGDASPEELKKAQNDVKACKKKLDDAWKDVTNGLNKVTEAGRIAMALPQEMKMSVYNDFSKVLSQTLNLVQNINQFQNRGMK